MRRLLFWTVLFVVLAGFWPGLLEATDSAETVKMSISANENYLKRFRKEREVAAMASEETAAGRVSTLDKKIKNLEMENARLSKLLQKNTPPGKPAVPTTTKNSAVPALPQTASRVVPLPVALAVPAPFSGLAVTEWEKMSREEKEKYVQALVDSLKKEGRVIQRHPLFYTALMDYVFVSDAKLAAQSLRDAVLATIQKNERSFN